MKPRRKRKRGGIKKGRKGEGREGERKREKREKERRHKTKNKDQKKKRGGEQEQAHWLENTVWNGIPLAISTLGRWRNPGYIRDLGSIDMGSRDPSIWM